MRIYFCWLLIYKKMPFDDFDFADFIYNKLESGRFQECVCIDSPDRIVAVVKGGSRRDFEDLKGKRVIEITTFVCDLLLELFNTAKYEKGENIT